MADLFTRCVVLKDISLRGMPVDEALVAIATSPARATLRSIDLAFSTIHSDASVRALIDACDALSSCSLRGARRVSYWLFLEITALMQQRGNQPVFVYTRHH